MWIGVVGGLGVLLVVLWLGKKYRISRARILPIVGDREFLEGLPEAAMSIDSDLLLELRGRVAEELRVPRLKLAPDQKLDDLADRFDFLYDFHLGWSHLEDDLVAGRRHAGIPLEDAWPKTVGEFVYELARAEDKSQARSNHSKSTEPVENE